MLRLKGYYTCGRPPGRPLSEAGSWYVSNSVNQVHTLDRGQELVPGTCWGLGALGFGLELFLTWEARGGTQGAGEEQTDVQGTPEREGNEWCTGVSRQHLKRSPVSVCEESRTQRLSASPGCTLRPDPCANEKQTPQ